VTSRRPGTPGAERKRQQRARDALLFERDDWRLFLDSATLPQKAGCQPAMLRDLVLREIVDNALDMGTNVTLRQDNSNSWTIEDDGPGLDPADVPRLFAVNRPLLSSKRKRLPTRGMVGNGLRVVTGAVAVSGGSLVVETRGRRLTLAVDLITDTTQINDNQATDVKAGLSVQVSFGPGLTHHSAIEDGFLAREAIKIARYGRGYSGVSSPWWYSARDLHLLMQQVMPADTTVSRLCRELGFTVRDDRIARSLDRTQATELLDRLRQDAGRVEPRALGAIGPDLYGTAHACHTGYKRSGGVELPFVVEAWANCRRPDKRGNGSARIMLLLNRTPSTANILASSDSGGLSIRGCGLDRGVAGPRTGKYTIAVSIITPHVALATDGKEPSLAPYSEAIAAVLRKACNAARRAMDKPPGSMSIKDAAWRVMPNAYLVASAGGRLPANARQVMYAARPEILRLTAKESLNDHYFTQVLLPDYIEEHPEITADWDVMFDDRGTFIEPHTGRVVPLGTLEVRQYLGKRSASEPPAANAWLTAFVSPLGARKIKPTTSLSASTLLSGERLLTLNASKIVA
jgi:hypothetical protein